MTSDAIVQPQARRRAVAKLDARWHPGVVLVSLIGVLQIILAAASDRAVIPQIVRWIVQMPVTVYAVDLLYRYVKQKGFRPYATVVATITLSAVIGTLFGVVVTWLAVRYPILRVRPDQTNIAQGATVALMVGLLHCGLWALAFVLPSVVTEARLRSVETDRLRAEGEIERLRSYLEPHFIANTLNAIAGLVTEDPREARRLLACLGDLLRDAVRTRDETWTVEQEVSWLKRYASLLEARFGDALRFEWDIAPDVGRAILPRLLMQPILENAVRHGALKRADRGCVKVTIRRTETGRLACSVADDGPGMDHAREGFGLLSVRRLLELRHDGAKLLAESTPDGTSITMDLPPLTPPALERT